MKYKEEYCLKRELIFDRKGSQEVFVSCEPFLFTLNISDITFQAKVIN